MLTFLGLVWSPSLSRTSLIFFLLFWITMTNLVLAALNVLECVALSWLLQNIFWEALASLMRQQVVECKVLNWYSTVIAVKSPVFLTFQPTKMNAAFMLCDWSLWDMISSGCSFLFDSKVQRLPMWWFYHTYHWREILKSTHHVQRCPVQHQTRCHRMPHFLSVSYAVHV